MCEGYKGEIDYYLIESDWKVEVLKCRKTKSKEKIASIIISQMLLVTKSNIR